jgi:hypothetical protein
VQQQASELARGVVYELLNDKRALQLSAQFLNEVIQREETKSAVLSLVKDVLGRSETEVALRNLVSNVLTHPESAQKAVKFLQHVVAIPESRDALVTVLTSVLAQPSTQAITSSFFTNVMSSDSFIAASNKLGSDTVHYLLGDEELKATAVQWCNAVLNDPALQSTAGDAVWAAVKGAFVPWGKPKLIQPPVSPSSLSASSATIKAAAPTVDASELAQAAAIELVDTKSIPVVPMPAILEPAPIISPVPLPENSLTESPKLVSVSGSVTALQS